MNTEQNYQQNTHLSAFVAALKSYPLTCVVIALGTLSFAFYLINGIDGLASLMMTPSLAELSTSAEFWRVLTPVFIHYHWAHVGVNLYLWWLFASTIEKLSPITLSVLFLSASILGNISQFFLTGAKFGGLSGVVYALFAYILVSSKLSPEKGLFVLPWLSWALLLLLVLGFTPLLGLISNGAHVSGLAIGTLCACIAYLRKT